jgi:hypothetical protein
MMKKKLFLILLMLGLALAGCATGSYNSACGYSCNIVTYCGRGGCDSYLSLACNCR